MPALKVKPVMLAVITMMLAPSVLENVGVDEKVTVSALPTTPTMGCVNVCKPVKVLAAATRGTTEVTISTMPVVPPEHPAPAQSAPLGPVTRSPQLAEVPFETK